ncbi:collagenase-like isoform X2 [Hermetia illucens]|uniref:collagenase-like isoform X2 n=1 Tax=Hermetia illucens TaxID=343691 RepID=UPI0018CC4AE9|nr:collagenase-like isoform X2 [Hermetia illucens]
MRFAIFILCHVYILSCTNVATSKLIPTPHSRISGGSLAGINEFPWHVYILANGDGIASTCGGSILSETWVLTAAHCTHGFLNLDLYFGSTDVYSMPTIISSTYWIEHSQYDPSNYNNDISVVQLESALNYTPGIQPMNLISPSESSNDFVNEVATVLGFGYTSDQNPQESSDLLFTKVLIVPNTDCTARYGADIVTEKTLCAVGNASLDHSICSGDSGGAMVIKNENDDYVQIGINSFVSDLGCTTGWPSGYVRVGSYLEWISTQTGIRMDTSPTNVKFSLNRRAVLG